MKKATGHDGNSTKILRLAKAAVVEPVTKMINVSIKASEIPDDSKKDLVSPLHKKNSTLDKENYRPVSILPILSNLYERSTNVQLMDYFSQHFNIYIPFCL